MKSTGRQAGKRNRVRKLAIVHGVAAVRANADIQELLDNNTCVVSRSTKAYRQHRSLKRQVLQLLTEESGVASNDACGEV